MEPPLQAPTLRVTIDDVVPPVQREFTATFRIGRADLCELSIKHEYVSRQQLLKVAIQ